MDNWGAKKSLDSGKQYCARIGPLMLRFKCHFDEIEIAADYFKRVIAVYFFSLFVVGLLLTIIQKCPWGVDNVLAIKRILIVSFPASMAAAVSDTLK